MDYRQEWKIEINRADLFAQRSRVRAVMEPDAHAVDGVYHIRSLYFDSPTDRALREKIDGVNRREKFRIRFYNGDVGFLRLEKKSKLNGLCAKQTAVISPELAQTFADGRLPALTSDAPPLLREFCYKVKTEGLLPKVVVDYTREAYLYRPGDVRVTFDSGIRTASRCADFLSCDLVTIPAGEDAILMEVKWGAFLPDLIRDAVGLTGRRAGAFSKYAKCRIYG